MEPPPAERAKAELDKEYSKENLRKELFKAYLQQHRIVDRLNRAIQELYKQGHLPEDPMEFIRSQLGQQQ